MHFASARIAEARRGRVAHAPWLHPGLPPGWTAQGERHVGRYFWLQPARPAATGGPTGADYLLKGIRRDCSGDRWLASLLEREAWIGMHVSHPHLVPVLELAWVADQPVLVMPYLDGRNLGSVLQSVPLFGIPQALWIARQLADSLHCLHGAGWVHGDIKPANVLIDTAGHVTLVDLGSALPLGGSDATRGRVLSGTLEYTAPERFAPHARVDGRSDLYSMGILLYVMLTGRLPFDGQTGADFVGHHRSTRVPDPGGLVPDLPPAVTRLVLELLAKEPIRRPASARELAERLVELELQTIALRLQSRPSADWPR
jgi:serine/threonine-protein kinase